MNSLQQSLCLKMVLDQLQAWNQADAFAEVIVCCLPDKQTIARNVLLPLYNSYHLAACSRRVNATAGSFTARASSTLGIVERMRFAMARSVATNEAQNTCEAAAAPTDAPVDRQGFDFGTADATRGEWRVVRNRAGGCRCVAYCIGA